MTAERYATLCRAVDMRTRYMTVCMENTFHPQNASALVRNCEAFGVQELHAVEELCRFSPNVQIVRGTDKWIEIRKHPTTAELIGSLRGRGYRIVATTPHLDDATPETFDVAAGPFALFFGTEHAGISDEVKAGADEFLRIPMCGMVESLNVSASAAILLYSLSTRVRAMDIPAGTASCALRTLRPGRCAAFASRPRRGALPLDAADRARSGRGAEPLQGGVGMCQERRAVRFTQVVCSRAASRSAFPGRTFWQHVFAAHLGPQPEYFDPERRRNRRRVRKVRYVPPARPNCAGERCRAHRFQNQAQKRLPIRSFSGIPADGCATSWRMPEPCPLPHPIALYR